MTQEELLHHIRAEFAGSRIDYEKCAQEMLTIFNKHVKEVIGEDISDVPDSITGNVERRVKAEQRKRAELQ